MDFVKPFFPALRFAVWIIAGIGALGGQLPWLKWMRLAPSKLLRHAGQCSVLVCLAVIFFLLLTTPPDAIRLPRWLSEILILGGAVSLYLLGDPKKRGWSLMLTAALLLALRLARKSPWWAVLVAWFPVYGT